MGTNLRMAILPTIIGMIDLWVSDREGHYRLLAFGQCMSCSFYACMLICSSIFIIVKFSTRHDTASLRRNALFPRAGSQLPRCPCPLFTSL